MTRVLVVIAMLAGNAHAAPDLEALTKAAPTCDAARATCIGLSLHVAIDETGVPVATADWITGQLAGANLLFEKLAIGFQIVAIDALPASAMRVEDRKQRDSFGPRVKGTVIHVFVTGRLDDVDKPGEVIRGVAWRRGTTKFVILSTIAPARVLAHELGHVFGLPHSTYPISIMNKTERKDPPYEQRTFADEELEAMKPRLKALLHTKALVAVKPR